MTMSQNPTSYLLEIAQPNATIGLVGVGNLGRQLQQACLEHDLHALLCDPPLFLDDLEELNDTFQLQWGNGMGGCTLSGAGADTFLPLDVLLKTCDIITVQIPETTAGPYATRALINRQFLNQCRPDTRIICFSSPAVIAPDAADDPRLVLWQW